MTDPRTELIDALKELKELSNSTYIKLEDSGLTITNLNKEQLFRYNLRNIIKATEALIRNEPSEKHALRLKKEIPDTYENVKSLLTTKAGKINSLELDRIKELTSLIESNVDKL